MGGHGRCNDDDNDKPFERSIFAHERSNTAHADRNVGHLLPLGHLPPPENTVEDSALRSPYSTVTLT